VEKLRIEVVNWAHYNPRSDRGGFAWFRMDNQFYLHMRQRKGLSARATVLMGLLLAEASSNNGDAFALRIAFAGEMLGYSEKQVRQALEELIKSGEIRDAVQSGTQCETESEILKRLQAASALTDGRTDGHGVWDVETLESLYAAYPKRKGDQGKKQAFKRLEKFTGADFDRLRVAVKNYAAYCSAEKVTGTPYVKQFLTFVNSSWEEWAEKPAAAPVALKTLEDLEREEGAVHA
jgi:hypothetical protein